MCVRSLPFFCLAPIRCCVGSSPSSFSLSPGDKVAGKQKHSDMGKLHVSKTGWTSGLCFHHEHGVTPVCVSHFRFPIPSSCSPETGPHNSILYIARTAEAEAFWEHSLLSRLNVRLKPLRILMLNPNPLKNNIWSGAFEKWLGHKVTGHQQSLLPVTHKCQWAEAEIQSLKLCFIQRDSNLWRPWINTLKSLPASSLVPCALLAVMWGGRGGGRSCQSWYLGFHHIISRILPSFSGRLGSDTSRNGESSSCLPVSVCAFSWNIVAVRA